VAQVGYDRTASATFSDTVSLMNLDTVAGGGWVTNVSLRLLSMGGEGAPTFQPAVYDGTTRKWRGTAVVISNSSFENLSQEVSPPARFSGSAPVRWGARLVIDSSNNEDVQVGYDTVSAHTVERNPTVADPWAQPPASTAMNTAYAGTLTYTPNSAPLQGSWVNPPGLNSGSSATFTLSGTLPHGATDASLGDTTASFFLYVRDETTNTTVLSGFYTPTPTELANGYFERSITLANPLNAHSAKYYHVDSFGASSPYSATISFSAQNNPPDPGAWRTPAEGAVTSTQVLLTGYIGNPPSDVAFGDYTANYDLQVWRPDTGAFVVNGNFNLIDFDRTNGYFQKLVSGLIAGVAYAAKYRSRDSRGLYGLWSPTLNFTAAGGPNPPEPLGPSGKLDDLSGFDYTALYDHPSGVAADRVRVRVYNSLGTSLLYDSGEVVQAVADGGTITVPEWHADLPHSTGFRVEFAARSTVGGVSTWSQYSAKLPFNTNAPPVATDLEPSDDAFTPTLTLTARVTDPDGDPVTSAEAELRTAAGVLVDTYAGVITGTAPEQVATFTVPSGDVVFGTRYAFRVLPDDGIASGPPDYRAWSADAYYHYQEVPVVGATVPDPVTVPNPTFPATYDHPNALARTHKKVVVQLQDGSETTHDSGWVADAGASGTTFDAAVPAGGVANDGDYRVKVYARDSGGGEGESPWYPFTTAYPAPPAPVVSIVEADPLEGVLRFTLEPSTLSALEFAGLEVARRSLDGSEPFQTVHIEYDPEQVLYEYHFPVSGKEYEFFFRQYENVGTEQVDGPWATMTASVSYPGRYFVKAVDDPGRLWVAYEVPREALRKLEEAPDEESAEAAWGMTSPAHVASIATRKRGSEEIRSLRELAGQTMAQARANLREILASPRAICVLAHYPETGKVFASRVGAVGFDSFAPKMGRVAFSWEETNYSEDVYERDGMA
jgi:hypothetical protein